MSGRRSPIPCGGKFRGAGVVRVLGNTKGGGEEGRERRLPFQRVVYSRREQSKFLFSPLMQAAANPPSLPRVTRVRRGRSSGLCPFLCSFLGGRGTQPARRRGKRTPLGGSQRRPPYLCALSEASHRHVPTFLSRAPVTLCPARPRPSRAACTSPTPS